MSVTRTDSFPRGGAIIAVIAVHLIMFYAISSGLNVTKIIQPLEAMVTVFVPDEKPAEPAAPVPKISDAKVTDVVPQVEPVVPIPEIETEQSVPIEAPSAPPTTAAPITAFSIEKRVDPLYPAAARRAGEQGTVLLELVVAPDGRPTEVNILRSSGFPLLDQAAIDAVRKWRFSTKESGFARLQLPVTFKLENAR